MRTIMEIITCFCNNYGSFMPISELRERWQSEHPACFGEFDRQLQAMMCAGLVRMEFDRVYLERVWEQENYVAGKLHSFQKEGALFSSDLPDELLLEGLRLTQEQRDAVETCLRNRLTLLLGPAGTGKTTIAQAILAYSGASNPQLCSPTGKAAKVLGTRTNRTAGTVHRTLGIRKLEDFLSVEVMDDIDLIIVDEATMLTIDMLAGILRAAPDNCRIILMGDRNQLPAIGPGDVINDLLALGFRCVILSANHRIAASGSALARQVIRFDDIQLSWQLQEDESFRPIYSQDEGYLMREIATEAAVRYRRGESVQVLSLRNTDVMEINRLIQSRLNPKQGKRLLHAKDFDYVEGDRVIIVENDYQQGCFNGEIGILRIEEDGCYSVELGDGRRPMWSVLDAPVKILPAYAITVHRSQGSEYDTVLMYVPRCSGCILHRNSFYTGISRARHELLLYADPAAVGFALKTLPPKRNSVLVEKVGLQELMKAG